MLFFFVKASNLSLHQALSYNNKLSEWWTSSFTFTFFFRFASIQHSKLRKHRRDGASSYFECYCCSLLVFFFDSLKISCVKWVVKFDSNMVKCRCSSSNLLIRDDECNNDMESISFPGQAHFSLACSRFILSYNCSWKSLLFFLLLLLHTFTDVCMSVFRFWCRNFSFFPYECLFVCLRVTEANSIDSHDNRTTSSSYKQQ